jgi:hypothetical protein
LSVRPFAVARGDVRGTAGQLRTQRTPACEGVDTYGVEGIDVSATPFAERNQTRKVAQPLRPNDDRS